MHIIPCFIYLSVEWTCVFLCAQKTKKHAKKDAQNVLWKLQNLMMHECMLTVISQHNYINSHYSHRWISIYFAQWILFSIHSEHNWSLSLVISTFCLYFISFHSNVADKFQTRTKWIDRQKMCERGSESKW